MLMSSACEQESALILWESTMRLAGLRKISLIVHSSAFNLIHVDLCRLNARPEGISRAIFALPCMIKIKELFIPILLLDLLQHCIIPNHVIV